MEQTLSEQELVRRENLQKIRDLGIDPYPAEGFPVNVLSQEIKQNFKKGDSTYQEVVLAGRLMSRRIMGKASFAELQDSDGRIWKLKTIHTHIITTQRSPPLPRGSYAI